MDKVDLVKLDRIDTIFKDKPEERARAIAYEKVAVHGYDAVKRELHKYVVDRFFCGGQENDRQMSSPRMFFGPNTRLSRNKYAKLTCIQQACRGKADLIESQKDGGGFYISPKHRLTENATVSILIHGYAEPISGQIRHSEARFWNNKVRSGHGVYVSEEKSKNALAKFACAHGIE